jgi:hypothetical protein
VPDFRNLMISFKIAISEGQESTRSKTENGSNLREKERRALDGCNEFQGNFLIICPGRSAHLDRQPTPQSHPADLRIPDKEKCHDIPKSVVSYLAGHPLSGFFGFVSMDY